MSVAVQGLRLMVVGGAAGIGLATARLAQAAGARVALIDRQSGPDGMPTFAADVRDKAAVDAAVDASAVALGGLDALVFSAGVDMVKPLVEIGDEDWQRLIEINLTGAMRVCRAALPHFAASGGSIILVSSGAGLRPLHERTAYCASKAGLIMLAKTLALELAPRGIRANAICPGAVDTDLFRSGLEGVPDFDAAMAEVRARYALARVAEPEEIARAILFLAGPQASYVTGIAMPVDGGRTFH